MFLRDVLFRLKKASLKVVQDSVTYCGHLQGGVLQDVLLRYKKASLKFVKYSATYCGHLQGGVLQDVLLRFKKVSLKVVQDSANYCGNLQGGVPAGCITQIQESLPEGGTRFGQLLWQSSGRCSSKICYSDSRRPP